MRIIIPLFILLTLHASLVSAQNELAESTYTVFPDNREVNLMIEYRMNYLETDVKKDTTKNIFEKFFGGNDIKREKKAITVSQMKAELIHIVSNNKDFTLEPKFPKDILQIIDLIKGKRKKEQARKIYLQANPEKMMTSSENTTVKLIDGRYSKTVTLSYTWHLRIAKKTSINIPGFILVLENKIFQTQPMTIVL